MTDLQVYLLIEDWVVEHNPVLFEGLQGVLLTHLDGEDIRVMFKYTHAGMLYRWDGRKLIITAVSTPVWDQRVEAYA